MRVCDRHAAVRRDGHRCDAVFTYSSSIRSCAASSAWKRRRCFTVRSREATSWRCDVEYCSWSPASTGKIRLTTANCCISGPSNVIAEPQLSPSHRTNSSTNVRGVSRIFSERDELYAIARPSVVCLSVCRLSVTFVRPTQAVQIFGNIYTALGTLAIH